MDASSFNIRSEIKCEKPDGENQPASETSDVTEDKTEDITMEQSEEVSSVELNEQKTKDLELEFPDPPAKIDLFKAIFLSSSDDDDSESDDDKEKVKDVPDTVKEIDLESEQSTVSLDSSLPKNNQRNLSPPRGVFANLDLDAINIRRKDIKENAEETVVDNSEKAIPECTVDVTPSEQAMQHSSVTDMYGPVLPTHISVTTNRAASSSSNKTLPSVVAVRNSEWVEKTKKDVQHSKHKKHKKSSKHKKHKKSKHKKRH